MAAAAIPLIASGAKGAAGAVKNDIAVVRWTTQPKKKKGKKASPPKEVELHINGASIGMGLAALAGAGLIGAAALWASGMGLRVEEGSEKILKTRTEVTGDPANPTVRTYVFTGSNRPVRILDGYPEGEGILSEKERLEGWELSKKARTIVENTGSVEKIYNAYVFRNKDKRSVRMGNRPRFLSNGSGGTDWSELAAYTSPIPAVWLASRLK